MFFQVQIFVQASICWTCSSQPPEKGMVNKQKNMEVWKMIFSFEKGNACRFQPLADSSLAVEIQNLPCVACVFRRRQLATCWCPLFSAINRRPFVLKEVKTVGWQITQGTASGGDMKIRCRIIQVCVFVRNDFWFLKVCLNSCFSRGSSLWLKTRRLSWILSSGLCQLACYEIILHLIWLRYVSGGSFPESESKSM